ncbi:hypothetical protein AAT16_03670 [Salinicoccus halodurans]|uniref:Uncharacterized protein n=1 Tax=Salinicoccus halodurans TaxID=407035 RepID=A0ABM5T6L3_9STAP|nr:hypothetical protein AAT16_03670 [Salinicoccus halodurans]
MIFRHQRWTGCHKAARRQRLICRSVRLLPVSISVTFASSGYIRAPVHRLTDKAIGIRCAQLEEKELI